jgi:subtilisin family serine protease
MLNGHLLHQSNYRGEGMVIAVFDAGFQNVDQLPAFNNLWENDQILGVRDFEDKDGMVFDSHVHGTMVLSVMSVNMPETYVGTAPAAKYWLLRTEVGNSEYLIEEYNWLAAAEFADSAGVDLINSSLGYTTFDDTSQNHTYQDMDGFSTPVSKAASMAASKGILVVNSAGNLGNSAWHYISAPADADSIMSVGAVDPFSQYVSFSSTGPTADGRIKPDVSAQGMSTATQYVDSSFVMGNGTSFSAPLITGLTACLWQKYPELTNIEIINKIRRSSHQYSNPDSLLGYGIPNFAEAGEVGINELKKSSVKIFPNPFKNRFYINIPDVRLGDNPIYLNIYNMMGKKIYTRGLSNSAAGSHIRINALSNQPPGIYLIKLTIEPDYVIKQKLVKY